MFEVLNSAFENGVTYVSDAFNSIFGSSGAQPADAGSWIGADGWGSGVAESVGINASSGATAAGWAAAPSLAGQVARSAASALGATGRTAQQTRSLNPNSFRGDSGEWNPIMTRPRRLRESEAPPVASNPFSGRHPLAGWSRSLIGD